MKILFYQPYNQIVVYIESIAEEFVKQGHEVFFLSHAERGETHKNMEKIGVKSFHQESQVALPLHQIVRVRRLVKFCKENDIDVVYSHFQEANIVAVLAQRFLKAGCVITRHHSDSAFQERSVRQKLADIIINRLAKVYIAPSRKVYNQIVQVEGCNKSKVRLINYGYNFANFRKVDQNEVKRIREEFPATLLLVQAARFITEKRHKELMDAMATLAAEQPGVKLLLLGRGPLESMIKEQVVRLNLTQHVFFLGFKLNIMDYYAAADLVVHFSSSEASNSAIKEAAITDTTVVVCKDVGDFDDYIVHQQNGFLLDKENPAKEFVETIREITKGQYDLNHMGKVLHADVIKRFDIKNVIAEYEEINEMMV